MDQSKVHLDLIVFSPHPDDAELYCGGTLIKLGKKGYRTGIVDLTQGELSSRGTLENRAKEAQAASEALGLSHRECLKLPDGAVGKNERLPSSAGEQTQTQVVIECLRRLRPEIVLVPYFEERHPDHEGGSELLTRAIFLSGLLKIETPGLKHHTPRQVIYYPMRINPRVSFVVDVSNEYPEKLQAIRAYKSQLDHTLVGEKPRDEAKTLVGSPLMLHALEGRDRYYGALVGAHYGEPYYIRNTLSLTDPIDFFRKTSHTEAMFFET